MSEQTLGSKIRELREQQNLSREQLYLRTKILVKYIKALEEGRWDLLPGQMYLKPFVKNIAQTLGADTKELYDLIKKSSIMEKPESQIAKRKIFDYRWLVAVFMLAVVSFIIFQLKPSSSKTESINEEQPAEVNDSNLNYNWISKCYSNNFDISPGHGKIIQYHTLKLAATDSVWLMLTDNGETLYEGILAPGRKIIRQVAGPFELNMGKANCIEIYYDDKKIDNDSVLKDRRYLKSSDLIFSNTSNSGADGES